MVTFIVNKLRGEARREW